MILEGLYKSTEIKTLSLRSVDLNFTSIPKIPKLINPLHSMEQAHNQQGILQVP
jgi:hypothetical protein